MKKIFLILPAFLFAGELSAQTYIAFSGDGAWGSSTSAQGALNKCINNKGKSCKLVRDTKGGVWSVRSGNYLSVYRSPSNVFGFGAGKSQKIADTNAYNMCKSHADNCAKRGFKVWVAK